MEYKLGEMVACNPTVKLEKGEKYNLVDIDSIQVGTRYVKGKELQPFEGKSGCRFQNGDTVMARITPCLENGKIAQIQCESEKGFGSTELLVFRGIKGKTDSDYVFYLMSTDYIRKLSANSMSGASGRQRADLSFIKNIKWDFPSLSVQQRIASILNNYDKLIQNYQKQIENLQNLARELYKEWFVRFRFHGHEKASFENGIPAGWKYEYLQDIISFVRGVSYSSEEINCDDGINLINLKNIESYGGFRRDGLKKFNGKYKKDQLVCHRDLIMGITDMTQERRLVGSVALIPILREQSVISADLVKITSKITNVYFYSMCKFGPYSRYFSMFANGSNVLHLRPTMLSKKKILVPTMELVQKYDTIVEPILNKVDQLNLEIDNLAKQKDLLLPRLISGKLEVK